MGERNRVDARKHAREARRQQRAERIAAMSEPQRTVLTLFGSAIIIGLTCLAVYACQLVGTSEPTSAAADGLLTKMEAIDRCKDGVLERASHPSTVQFPRMDYDFRPGVSGDNQLLMSASAKNGFGLELQYDVRCEFTDDLLRNVVMSEARAQ